MTDTSAAFGQAADQFFKLVQADSADIEARKASSSQLMIYTVTGTVGIAIALILLVYQLLDHAVVRPLKIAADELTRVARGDLTNTITHESGNELGLLFKAMKAMQTSLVDIVTVVRTGTDSIATGVHQLAGGHADLSARTEEQAGSLQTTAASMEQLTVAVQHNTDNAQQASGSRPVRRRRPNAAVTPSPRSRPPCTRSPKVRARSSTSFR